jgi:two-component system chemotaxis response regulator CheY
MAFDLNARVLVVDDYMSMVELLHDMLRQLGYRDIERALDGETALRKFREQPCDLVISDWYMEPMSGLDLLRAIRAEPVGGQVPFVMITAAGKPENVATARQAGVSNFIVKPFNAATLRQKIAAVGGPA